MSIETGYLINIAGLEIRTPIMNGAGPVKLSEQVLEIAKSDSAAVVLGSITVDERLGNSGTTYFDGLNFSLNSRGLPNPGVGFYKKQLPEMVRVVHDFGKPLIVSIAGFSPEEYAVLLTAAINCNADGVEINLGCPNVWGKDGKQKRIASFDIDLIGEILFRAEQEIGASTWTSIKFSPFSDPFSLEAIALEVSRSKLIKAVVSTNTFPNAYSFNHEGKPAIDPAGGLAGLAGKALKPIGLGQVKQLRALLLPEIAVIGVGGIFNKEDAEDYLRAGATAIQVTTAFIKSGPQIFSEILGKTSG